MIGTDPVAARLGQVIQAMGKAVGFDIDLQPTEFVDLAQPRRRRQFHVLRDRLVGTRRP